MLVPQNRPGNGKVNDGGIAVSDMNGRESGRDAHRRSWSF